MNENDKRIALERRIVRYMLRELARAGWTPAYTDTGDDGDQYISTPNESSAMREIFSVDTCTLTVRNAELQHGILLVLGNGIDVITDYSYRDNDSDGFDKLMERIQDTITKRYE